MDCKKAKCIHYVHKPADGVWCKVHGEFYQQKIAGFCVNCSEPTNHSFTDSSVCGDFEPEFE